MSLHFPLPKIRTWRWVYTFPYQKFALFVSPFTLPIFPSMVTIVALKFAMSSHFPLPKNFALFVPTLSSGAIVLPIEKMNQINTKNYWKEKKRLCVRLRSGDKHHLRKSANRKAQIRNAFVLLTRLIGVFDLQIFSGGVYPPSATERTISFSISNSFGINYNYCFERVGKEGGSRYIVCTANN